MADAFFDGEDNREIGRALDRDTRVAAVALLCALTIAAAASGVGSNGSASGGSAAASSVQSQPQAGQPPAVPTGRPHAVSGGS